jgi:hypothetical protein
MDWDGSVGVEIFSNKIFCSFSQSVCYAYFSDNSCYNEISETFNKL